MAVPEVQPESRRTESAPEGSCWPEERRSDNDGHEIIGGSASLRDALALVRLVADTDTTVFLTGETGTGKELIARAIHRTSSRRHRPLVRVNCAALPATLIEAELFGHDRGAFTGAVSARQGRFELADKGTLFLDEIGDLSIDLQSRLLRVLEEGEFERIGSSHTRCVDVRVITATHRNLEAAVAAGHFREDLYHRLTVFPIQLPPLRERREDIPQLVWHFVNERQRALRRNITEIPTAVMSALQAYAWPGNIRELRNVVERAMILSTGESLTLPLNAGPTMRSFTSDQTLESVERCHIESVLRQCHWRINGAGNAAERLGLHPNTLRFRLRKLGVVRPVPQLGSTSARHVTMQ